MAAGISPYLEGRQSLPDREGRERDSISGLSPLRNRGTGSAERMAAGIPGLIASQNELPGGSGKRSAPIPLHDPVFFAAEQGCRRRGTDSRGNFSVTTPFCSSIAYRGSPGMKRRQARIICPGLPSATHSIHSHVHSHYLRLVPCLCYAAVSASVCAASTASAPSSASISARFSSQNSSITSFTICSSRSTAMPAASQ